MSALQRGSEWSAGSAVGGVALLGAAGAWWLVSGTSAGGSPAPAVALIGGAATTLVVAWVAAARRPTLVLLGLVGAAIAVFGSDAGATLRAGPLEGPFGYANASAAFFAQAFVAALLLTVVGRGPLRVVGAAAAIAFTPLVLVSASWTAGIGLPLLVAVALGVERLRGARAAVAACAGVFLVALVATIVLGAIGVRSGAGPLDRLVDATLSQERVALWNDALSITARRPMFGVGPGRFARTSPIALSDPDLRWAHNEFLQAGAETGLVGYALLVGVFVWGFAALAEGAPGRVAVLSAAGVSVLAVQATVDYVLHFPFVVLAGAAVLGAGLGITRGLPGRIPSFVPGEPVRGPA